jgi:hypothetical protein
MGWSDFQRVFKRASVELALFTMWGQAHRELSESPKFLAILFVRAMG